MKNRKLTDWVRTYIIKCHPVDFTGLSVKEIARRFQVNPSFLSRAFKEEQGISLKAFLFNEKITRSRFILKQNQTLPIKSVAKMLGFSSSDYFIRVFKTRVGVTPGEFREIDNSFYGLHDRRTAPAERRSKRGDRREFTLDEENIPGSRNRRRGLSERRMNPPNRRRLFPDPKE